MIPKVATTLLSAAAALAAANNNVLGFAPAPSNKIQHGARTSSFISSSPKTISTTTTTQINMNLGEDLAVLSTNPPSNLTPEGYGFSSPVGRILKSRGGTGYYKAKSTDSVITVMEGLSSGDIKGDVALVYDNDEVLVGIFTDADYIRLATERSATSSEEESASFMAAPISNFITPSSNFICVEEGNTASQAVAIMTTNNVRHTLLVDKCGPNFSYLNESNVLGVISMQDVLRVIQVDERLSFDKLSQKFPGLADKPIEQMREELKSKANSLARNEETAKKDIIRAVTAIISAGSVALFASQSAWLHSHSELAMIGIFVLGYIGIIFEEVFEFNKAAVALLMSTGLWVTYADFYGGSSGIASDTVLDQLKDQLAEVSDICFFLLAASAIVEVVDAHQGFKVVTNLITTKSKKGLFWVIGFLTFFLSAILNNLTVTIVMVSLLRKLIPNDDDRRLFGAMVVVAANAGGVWTPIGDVTTTMLWINNQLSTIPTVTELFLPSIVCLVASLFFLVNQVEEDTSLSESSLPPPSELSTRGTIVFWSGIACLLSVPIFAELTGLPPYLAMYQKFNHRKNHGIDIFRIINVQLQQEVLDMLAPALQTLKIKFLGLDGNIGSDVLSFVERIVQRNCHLEQVGWRNQIESVDDMRQFCNSIKNKKSSSLNAIGLYSSFDGNSPEMMRIVLDASRPLSGLGLLNNGIGTVGTQLVANFLASNPPLRFLDLKGNNLNDTDTTVVANALQSNTNINKLDLNDNDNITSAGRQACLESVFDVSSLNACATSNHRCRIHGLTPDISKINKYAQPLGNKASKIFTVLSATDDGFFNMNCLGDVSYKLIPDVLRLAQRFRGLTLELSEAYFEQTGQRSADWSQLNEDTVPITSMFELLRGWAVPSLSA